MALIEFLTSLSTLETLLVFVVTLCTVLFLRKWWESRSLPPGPWGLPFLGYTLFIKKQMHLTFTALSKKYGPIYTVNMGNTRFVMINGYDKIKELFLKYPGEVFHGKPKEFTFQGWFSDFQGVIEEDGEVWRVQRRFLLTTLRDFGFGKNVVAENIKLESEKVTEIFRKQNGPIDPEVTLANFAANIISALVLGERFDYEDPAFKRLRDGLDFKKLPNRSLILMGSPWLRFFPIKSLFGMDSLEHMKNSLRDFFHEQIKKHKETLDENNIRDLIDAYLIDMKKEESNSWMTYERLVSNASILFNAGQFTVSLTLHWALRLMMEYPEVQKKVQEELDEVIGQERLPEWGDRVKLPYTEAALMEVQRFATPIPLNVQHAARDDIEIDGFTIPKGSLILSNLYSAMHDPKYWKNPERFDPNHFLDKDGKLLRNESYIPFSIGKRACLGETLARMELFLFFTIVLQRLHLKVPPGETLNYPPKNFLEGTYPGHYKMLAIPRF